MSHKLNFNQQRVREDVSLLSMLNAEPGNAIVHTSNESAFGGNTPPTSANRALSFSRERDLVNELAFLAGRSRDRLKVTALCIEESSESSLNIRVATNTGAGDLLKSGLNKLAKALERAAKSRM